MATTIEHSNIAAAAEDPVPEDVFGGRLDTENFQKTPHCIYLFYIGQKDQGTGFNRILHYYDRGDADPIDTPAKLEQRLGALIRNAREPNVSNQYPPPHGSDWRDVVLDRISYVAIAFDFPMTTEPTFSVKYNNGPHHSFYDGRMLEIEGCKVGVCVNQLKSDAGGTPMGRETQPFLFDLVSTPAITWEGMVQWPESGGTNQGPGAPPPE